MDADQSRPAHHDPDGGFRNPWPTAQRDKGGFLRWQWERLTGDLPPNPAPGALPVVRSDIAYPREAAGEVRVTWVGHSTFLIQAGGANLLTDPVWSERASPAQWAGPARFVPPGISFDRLPPIDAVLLSHDHYDHLDEGTTRRLHAKFDGRVRWFTPLGYADWYRARGVENVTEMDWWDEAAANGPAGVVSIVALPAQHWTSRTVWDRNRRLWTSWGITAPGGRRIYFGGDSGWFPGYPEIGERAGPFDLVLLPIGAYEPLWFMRLGHMNPEEATRAYQDLGGNGILGAMHWGTFRLTDEDPLEPPVRMRAAWAGAGLPPDHLWIAAHGETRVIAAQGGAED